MSVLTKEERDFMRSEIDCCPAAYQFDGEDMARALDTIDALERIIKGIESATSMHQVETCLIAARAFGVIEEAE